VVLALNKPKTPQQTKDNNKTRLTKKKMKGKREQKNTWRKDTNS
jgi:hypothetical protein